MVVDHLGNEFDTTNKMCKYHKIPFNTFRYRISKGYSLEEALSGDYGKFIDHLGNKFKTKREMCDYHGVKVPTFDKRIKDGKPISEALESCEYHSGMIKDHDGNVFSTKEEMCKHYGLSSHTLSNRLDKGMALKEALTKGRYEEDGKSIKCKDYEGNMFNSKTEMCNHYGIRLATFNTRIESGWSLKEALCREAKNNNNVVVNGWRLNYIIYQKDDIDYYYCTKGVEEEILTMDEMRGVV